MYLRFSFCFLLHFLLLLLLHPFFYIPLLSLGIFDDVLPVSFLLWSCYVMSSYDVFLPSKFLIR